MLRLMQVDDAAIGPQVSDNIQMVYIVDDLSGLTPPPPAINVWFRMTEPASVIEFSGIDIKPPPNSAIIIDWIRNDSAIAVDYRVGGGPADELTTITTVETPVFTTGGVTRATLREGTTFGTGGTIALAAGAEWGPREPNIIILPGQTFLCIGGLTNNAVTMSGTYREVPVP